MIHVSTKCDKVFLVIHPTLQQMSSKLVHNVVSYTADKQTRQNASLERGKNVD